MKELSSYIDNVQEGFYQNADASLLSTLNKCLFRPVLADGENFYFTISNKGILSLNIEGLKVYFSRDGYHYYNSIKIDLFLSESQQILEFVSKFGKSLRWYVEVRSKKLKPAADIVDIEIKLYNVGHYITHVLFSGVNIIDYRISKQPSLNDWIKEGFYNNTKSDICSILSTNIQLSRDSFIRKNSTLPRFIHNKHENKIYIVIDSLRVNSGYVVLHNIKTDIEQSDIDLLYSVILYQSQVAEDKIKKGIYIEPVVIGLPPTTEHHEKVKLRIYFSYQDSKKKNNGFFIEKILLPHEFEFEDERTNESFYKNTNTHNYTLLKKAVEQLNELNTDWKHEKIPDLVNKYTVKILKNIESIIGDFVIVQRCIKGYTSHYIYYEPEDPVSDKWWTVGTLYINSTSDNSISINRINIDTGSNKYIGNRVLSEIEAGVVEGFKLGVIKNDKIEII